MRRLKFLTDLIYKVQIKTTAIPKSRQILKLKYFYNDKYFLTIHLTCLMCQ